MSRLKEVRTDKIKNTHIINFLLHEQLVQTVTQMLVNASSCSD